jgi:GntR family transcriptional repressor for pyruvate dehydrogenase complex
MSQSKVVFTPIKSRRAFEEVANQIKQMIFQGIFNPGDKLPPESELAAQFGVGRQSIREALRILELSGFISTQKGGGGGSVIKDAISATISRLFLDACHMEKIPLEELTQARVEIERVVLRHAVLNADEADLKALRDNLREARGKSDANKVIVAENIQFHMLMAEASKNKLFVIVVQAITGAVRHFMAQLKPDPKMDDDEAWYNDQIMRSRKTLAYHEAIVDAMEVQDVEKATDALERHLREVETRLKPLSESNAYLTSGVA